MLLLAPPPQWVGAECCSPVGAGVGVWGGRGWSGSPPQCPPCPSPTPSDRFDGVVNVLVVKKKRSSTSLSTAATEHPRMAASRSAPASTHVRSAKRQNCRRLLTLSSSSRMT